MIYNSNVLLMLLFLKRVTNIITSCFSTKMKIPNFIKYFYIFLSIRAAEKANNTAVLPFCHMRAAQQPLSVFVCVRARECMCMCVSFLHGQSVITTNTNTADTSANG